MGRRSINTTKSGKYMNPTDQARKEARKKELKKNKRQRQMVRAAVLKNKDPGQILEEMEKIDEMEYNVMQPSPLNEKVLRDKRKKLKETFDRVMRLYHNDEPEHWAELKRKEVEYEKKRLKKQQYYESVKHAQSVQIDDIPLPTQANSASAGTLNFSGPPARMPPPPAALSLPPFAPSAPPGTLKKSNEVKSKPIDSRPEPKKKDPPGVPPGPPPNLGEMPDLDTDVEDGDIVLKEYNPKIKINRKEVPKPNLLQQRMLAISGQNIDEFMKEMENVHKKKEKERENIKKSSSSEIGKDDEYEKSDEDDDSSISSRGSQNSSEDSDSDTGSSGKRIKRASPIPAPAASAIPVAIPLPPTSSTSAAPTAPHIMLPAPPMPPIGGMPPPMLFRPPPLRPPGNIPNYGIRLAPGGPPVPRGGGMTGMSARMGIRMPPGPPPGMPPRMSHHQLQHKNQSIQKDTKGITTITAKPQIRNLSADVTRFVPSTLRVKREEVRKPNRLKPYSQDSNKPIEGNKTVTKDDAYLQFMNEMQGLL